MNASICLFQDVMMEWMLRKQHYQKKKKEELEEDLPSTHM